MQTGEDVHVVHSFEVLDAMGGSEDVSTSEKNATAEMQIVQRTLGQGDHPGIGVGHGISSAHDPGEAIAGLTASTGPVRQLIGLVRGQRILVEVRRRKIVVRPEPRIRHRLLIGRVEPLLSVGIRRALSVAIGEIRPLEG